MSLNLSLVKMPHSNFKDKAYAFNTGVGKCSCGKTFKYTSERDMKVKLRMHLRFCSNPPVAFDKIRVPKKATTLREQQLAEAERMHKVHNQYFSNWINIKQQPLPFLNIIRRQLCVFRNQHQLF